MSRKHNDDAVKILKRIKKLIIRPGFPSSRLRTFFHDHSHALTKKARQHGASAIEDIIGVIVGHLASQTANNHPESFRRAHVCADYIVSWQMHLHDRPALSSSPMSDTHTSIDGEETKSDPSTASIGAEATAVAHEPKAVTDAHEAQKLQTLQLKRLQYLENALKSFKSESGTIGRRRLRAIKKKISNSRCQYPVTFFNHGSGLNLLDKIPNTISIMSNNCFTLKFCFPGPRGITGYSSGDGAFLGLESHARAMERIEHIIERNNRQRATTYTAVGFSRGAMATKLWQRARLARNPSAKPSTIFPIDPVLRYSNPQGCASLSENLDIPRRKQDRQYQIVATSEERPIMKPYTRVRSEAAKKRHLHLMYVGTVHPGTVRFSKNNQGSSFQITKMIFQTIGTKLHKLGVQLKQRVRVLFDKDHSEKDSCIDSCFNDTEANIQQQLNHWQHISMEHGNGRKTTKNIIGQLSTPLQGNIFTAFGARTSRHLVNRCSAAIIPIYNDAHSKLLTKRYPTLSKLLFPTNTPSDEVKSDSITLDQAALHRDLTMYYCDHDYPTQLDNLFNTQKGTYVIEQRLPQLVAAQPFLTARATLAQSLVDILRSHRFKDSTKTHAAKIYDCIQAIKPSGDIDHDIKRLQNVINTIHLDRGRHQERVVLKQVNACIREKLSMTFQPGSSPRSILGARQK